ncbi:MAG: polysaccharide pyruvyl transferase family protein [Gemmatimonadaceae bacterium]
MAHKRSHKSPSNRQRFVARVGISGSYGGMNLGDEAILQAMIAQLRASRPVELTVFTADVGDTLKRHGVEAALPVRDLTRDEARQAVAQLDLLILGGGGILYDAGADAYLREVTLAREVGVPVMVYAISAGPLEDERIRKLVRETLDNVDVLTVRDRQGKRVLEDIGVERDIVVTADPAVLLEPQPLTEDRLRQAGIAEGKRIIAFSVREPGPAAPDIDVEHYHLLLAHAADFVIDRLEADVIFVPMEREHRDLQHSHAVVAKMRRAQRATVLKEEYTSGEVLALLGHCEFAIGMRLHFLIFAALQGVPFAPLPYASKVAGFIESVGMGTPVLKDVSAGTLLAMIDRSWDYREKLRHHITSTIGEVQGQARKNNELAVQLLDRIAGEKARTGAVR